MAEESKRVKLQAKEDRISALPDCLIQHILSLFPSTKQAIQTTRLSKRWHNQWTRVPVLIFDSTGMSVDKFSIFIDYTLLLFDCSKIKKFHIQTNRNHHGEDLNWHVKIRFAIRKDVEELFLKFSFCWFRVPEFVFEHASLVKLQMHYCNFSSMPNGRVSWGNLKELDINCCTFPNKAIENILSGSPSLESLELSNSILHSNYDIVSESLTKLLLNDVWSSSVQISCPNLEELKLFGRFEASVAPKLMNSSSLICGTLDFDYEHRSYAKINNIVQYFKHVKELKFGSQFIKCLSVLKLGKLGADLSSLLLNNKFLTLDSPNFEKHYHGIKCALSLSYVLEKLVILIKQPLYKSQKTTNIPDLNVSGKNYWNSNRTVFNCLTSHLKTVEINGLSEHDDNCKHVLNFIEFLLKNARLLEKLVVILKDGGKDFVIQVSEKLLGFPRCSQHAMVKMLCSN